jgi:hypothetical protein
MEKAMRDEPTPAPKGNVTSSDVNALNVPNQSDQVVACHVAFPNSEGWSGPSVNKPFIVTYSPDANHIVNAKSAATVSATAWNGGTTVGSNTSIVAYGGNNSQAKVTATLSISPWPDLLTFTILIDFNAVGGGRPRP